MEAGTTMQRHNSAPSNAMSQDAASDDHPRDGQGHRAWAAGVVDADTPASNGAGRHGCASVTLGGFDPLMAYALAAVLREDLRLNVLAGDLESCAPASGAAGGTPWVAVMSETAAQSTWPSIQSGVGSVVLAHEPTRAYGTMMLEAGVTCLDLRISVEDVPAAVHLTARGGCMFVSGDGGRVERPDWSKERTLTPREIQVLDLLSEGKSYGQIALALKISVETVKKHTSSLLKKLDARTKRDLIGLPVGWLMRTARSSKDDRGGTAAPG